jgi:transcriptional regulator with XRE-family HTH domain
MAPAKAKKSIQSNRYRQMIQRLRTARKDAGLTQSQVAARLDQPQSFVSKCESGERRVDALELERFAELYGKRLSFFLGKQR